MPVPGYLPVFVLTGAIATIAAILLGLARALDRAGWPAAERTRTVRGSAVLLIGWFALSAYLASVEFYKGTLDHIPTIQYGLLLPILIGGVLIWRSQFAARMLAAIPQQWLVSLQLYRALGFVFIMLYFAGRLPGLFAWPAGLGDVAVGLLAPVVGAAYARNPQANAGAVAAWNWLGLADLAVAVATGFLTSPSALQLFAFDNPNELISVFPLVLVPVYLVPLSIVLHIASLAKLKRETAPATMRAA